MSKYKINSESFYDALCLFLSVPLAYFLRAGTYYIENHLPFIVKISVLYMVIVCGVMTLFKVQTKIWEYTSIQDVMTLATSITIGTIFWYALLTYFHTEGEIIPRSIPFILIMAGILLTCGARIFIRFLSDTLHSRSIKDQKLTPVYLVGNIDAIDKVIVSLKHPLYSSYDPIGIIEHNKNNVGKSVRNIPVIGTIHDLDSIFKDGKKAELALFGDTSVQSKYTNDIFQRFTMAGIATIFLPNFGKAPSLEEDNSTSGKVDFNSLLRRPNYIMDPQKNFELINAKRIFITGAGGSIGSEIIRQICAFNPTEIVILDNSEYLLYLIDYEISQRFPHIKKTSILADIRDQQRINHLIKTHKPQIIFHAAAIKHVPMAQDNPDYAFSVNVLGTNNLLTAAKDHLVELMVLISTDKAVNPTSIMGATKQIAEMLCLSMNENAASQTQFLTVRFGNVIGSNGSVLPLFEKQIEEGGPVTITHKDIVRFFMTIPEAVDLVLETASIGQNKEINVDNGIFVLNMGEPVKIRELAEQLIVLKGKKPYETIDIVYTGLRPGEKLYEELFGSSEEIIETTHEWLKIASSKQKRSFPELEQGIQSIILAISENDLVKTSQLIKKVAINFQEVEDDVASA
jgi:FlaA1/EpsC-like NDP-sugar epimerase